MANLSPLITARDAAEVLQVSTSTIMRWGKKGTLRRVVVEGTVRYSREDVEAVLSQLNGSEKASA